MRQIMALTEGRGTYWCRKALNQGLRHLDTGQDGYEHPRWKPSNREFRRSDDMGTVWSPYNLIALFQVRRLINRIT